MSPPGAPKESQAEPEPPAATIIGEVMSSFDNLTTDAPPQLPGLSSSLRSFPAFPPPLHPPGIPIMELHLEGVEPFVPINK